MFGVDLNFIANKMLQEMLEILLLLRGFMKKKILIEGEVESLVLNSGKFEIEGDIEASDSYHSFDELYSHRIMLFLTLMKQNKEISWKTRFDREGGNITGWFIGGMELPVGQITYHIPDEFWDVLSDVKEVEKSLWDGHDSNDVIKRLNSWMVGM